MGKKRITVIGDTAAEEEKRQKKALKRQQKKLRKGEKSLSKAEIRAARAEKVHKGSEIDEMKDSADPRGEMMAIMNAMRKEREKEFEIELEDASTKVGRGPRHRSAKYKNRKSQTSRTEIQPTDKAVAEVLKLSYSKFDATVEMHVNLRKKDCFSQTTITLPHAAGKGKKVVALNDQILKQIEDGKIDFDVLYASPDQMKDLVKYAKFLGPRGMMPNPKNGTLRPDPKKAVAEHTDNDITLKAENKFPILHTTVGRTTMKADQIEANVDTVIKTIDPKNIESIYLASSMSPSVQVAVVAK